MGTYSVEQEAPASVRPRVSETADAWSREWPQGTQEFGELVDVYLNRLVRYASRRMGNVQDAEDVVQDVFVRAYLSRADHEDVTNVSAYLYRMTTNACADALRRRTSRTAVLTLARDSHDAAPAPQPGPLDSVRASEEALATERMLQRLPKAQAEAVRLRVFGELSLGEVAETMKCSINTANSRLRYAFKKLRRIVAKEWTP